VFNIVLVHPQIPQNTGSIGRMCVNTDCTLHIVKPTVFRLDEKSVKRAGLDYWHLLDLKVWESLDEFLEANKKSIDRFFFATTKTNNLYFDAKYQAGDFLFFGGESTGLPMELMKLKWENTITIPMGEKGRSLNQATSAGVVLYEAIRQNFTQFPMK
jgi:tRNA (cytidine/uridine-2'-O-)-methyltransferase